MFWKKWLPFALISKGFRQNGGHSEQNTIGKPNTIGTPNRTGNQNAFGIPAPTVVFLVLQMVVLQGGG